MEYQWLLHWHACSANHRSMWKDKGCSANLVDSMAWHLFGYAENEMQKCVTPKLLSAAVVGVQEKLDIGICFEPCGMHVT
jgi:hypothetical protein